jgi:two-component system cell cycle sensor histidine kinase/response regulator CckA
MKADWLFGLENAAWPVLLVDSSGTVRWANATAMSVFGVGLEGEPSLGAGLWPPENEQTPAEFLARFERSSSPAMLLRFRVKGGNTAVFLSYVSAQAREEEKYFLFQLFAPADKGPQAGSLTRVPREVELSAPADKGPQAAAGSPLPTAADSAVQKQKLDCAFQLTRSVALDFNNALTSILGHTSLILSQMPAGNSWRRSLMEVEKSAEKAAEIANDLAAFSRQERDAPTQEAGNLNDLLQRAVGLFRAKTVGQVEWELSLTEQLYSVRFDEAKMQQAFVKILENAVEAMGAPGRIKVLTRNVDLAEPRQDGIAQLGPGPYVCVEIADTGEGIAAEALPRIFEPFFSTKKGGRHRGLGLAWVYGIVTNHGGSVSVSSRLGEGTAVRVYLPAQKQFVKDRPLLSDDLTGHGTVLLVDDEDLVLTMGETILTAYGYTVFTANSGARALELVAQCPEKIDLVVTDLVMPQMSGRELIEHLQVMAPRLKLICSSGYVRSRGQEQDVGFLKKPFTSQDLLRKVKQALG